MPEVLAMKEEAEVSEYSSTVFPVSSRELMPCMVSPTNAFAAVSDFT
jgi:hypothetical protein